MHLLLPWIVSNKVAVSSHHVSGLRPSKDGRCDSRDLTQEQMMLIIAMWTEEGGYFALADLSLRFADRNLSFAGADIRLCFS